MEKSCSKINQKLLFVTKVAQKLQKLHEKTKTFFGLMLKYANCTTKVRSLIVFGVTSVAYYKTLSPIKTKNVMSQ